MAPKIIVAENNDQVATELINIVKGALDKIGDSSEKAIIGLSGKEIRVAMFCLIAVLIDLCGEVSKKGCKGVCQFERKRNWISVNAFLYFNSKVCKRLLKRCIWEKESQKSKKILIFRLRLQLGTW